MDWESAAHVECAPSEVLKSGEGNEIYVTARAKNTNKLHSVISTVKGLANGIFK